MRRSPYSLLIVLMLVFAAVCPAVASEADPFAPVRSLVGNWRGEASGFGGDSVVEHAWSFVLDDHFLRLETLSRPAGSPDSEPHGDVGYLSWSDGEATLRFRQFLSEGYVNAYRVVAAPAPADGLDFEPEGTEGMPGVSARLTLRWRDADSYEMVLELGAPGGKLTPCQTMVMRRAD